MLKYAFKLLNLLYRELGENALKMDLNTLRGSSDFLKNVNGVYFPLLGSSGPNLNHMAFS